MMHPARFAALPLVAVALLCPLAASVAQSSPPTPAARDTAFEAMQRRGQEAMGVDQYTSVHAFDEMPNGGRIELQRGDATDSVGVRAIREHLRGIALAFRSGDFSTPSYVHMSLVPGASVMAGRRNAIHYDYRELPRGAELRITTNDQTARRAIWQFLAYQRNEHMAGGVEMHGEPH
jgi:hypothetical protein